MVFSPKLGFMFKIFSSEYQLDALQGHFLRGACGKIFSRLDLEQKSWLFKVSSI